MQDIILNDSLLWKLAYIAEIEFADVIIGWETAEGKLRMYFADMIIINQGDK